MQGILVPKLTLGPFLTLVLEMGQIGLGALTVEKMVIKVKGREGRLNEKKCIEGRKGGVIAKKTSLEPGVLRI